MLFRQLVSEIIGTVLLGDVLYKSGKKTNKTRKLKRFNGAVFLCSPGFEVKNAGLPEDS